jgi:signal peptidase I
MPPRKRLRKKTSRSSTGVSEWIKAFLIALGILIIIRFFFIDLVSFSDSSMEKSLYAGDILVIKKSNYGARMPLCLLPASWFPSSDSLPKPMQLPYMRTPALSFPDYNHLVLINTPTAHHLPITGRSRTIKRIAGLPGDVFQIKNSEVLINGNVLINPGSAQWNHEVIFKRGVDVNKFFESYPVSEGTRVKNTGKYILPFTQKEAETLKSLAEISSIVKIKPKTDFSSPFGHISSKWDADNLGPMTIPYKGYSIELTPENLDLYFYHLIYHEMCNVEVRNDSVFINNHGLTHYQFTHDYYFFLGDNRHNTSDSRYWGLVPETHIIGKVSSVFISIDKNAGILNKIRWRRIFKTL